MHCIPMASPSIIPFRKVVDPTKISVDHERICLRIESDGNVPVVLDKRYICWSVMNTQKVNEIKFFIQDKDGILVLREHLLIPSLQLDVLNHLHQGRIPMYGVITHVQFSGILYIEAFSGAPSRAGPTNGCSMHRFYQLESNRATGLVDLSDFNGFAVGIYVSGNATIRLDDDGWGWPMANGKYVGFQILDVVFETPHVANGRYKINKNRRLWTSADHVIILFEEHVDVATATVAEPHVIIQPRQDSYPMTAIGPNYFIEGYWFNKDSPGTTCIYPLPKETNDDEYFKPEHVEWRARFRHVLDNIDAVGGYITEFMGSSFSRLTNERVGTREYNVYHDGINWKFPEGLRHYYLDRKVMPSTEFTTLINNLYALM